MYTLTKTINICCAHHLRDSKSLTTKQCLNLHGHNYKVTVTVKTYDLKEGMVIDFGKIKEIVMKLDHQNLNDFIDQPTAENIAKWLFDRIQPLVPETGFVEVELEETPGSIVKYEI